MTLSQDSEGCCGACRAGTAASKEGWSPLLSPEAPRGGSLPRTEIWTRAWSQPDDLYSRPRGSWGPMAREVSVHVPAWRGRGRWDAGTQGGQAVHSAAGQGLRRQREGPGQGACVRGDLTAGTRGVGGSNQWGTEGDGKLPERDEVLGRQGCSGSGNVLVWGCRALGVCPSRAHALAPGPPAGRMHRWASARDSVQVGSGAGAPTMGPAPG